MPRSVFCQVDQREVDGLLGIGHCAFKIGRDAEHAIAALLEYALHLERDEEFIFHDED